MVIIILIRIIEVLLIMKIEINNIWLMHIFHYRGFAFVEFYSADDAAEAHDKLEKAMLCGREIAIVFAKDKRKVLSNWYFH